MDIETVCIIGGSGFLGSSIADQACAAGHRVRVVTPSHGRARHLMVLPTLEVMVANVNDDIGLARAMEGMDAVINLAGILHPNRRASFKTVHVDLPRRIGHAARKAGVRRFLHMSALGASPTGPSDYLRSKGEGEATVRQGPSECAWTIFRPAVVFGEHDHFINLFAKLARLSPVIPLAAAQARFQPVWVEDVARCFVGSLGDPRTFSQSYDLCGPRVYTLEELVRFAATAMGLRRRIVRLPASIGKLQAFTFEHLPGRIMTRDNLRSMSVDNVCGGPFPAVFGFAPSAMEAVVPEYLAGSTTRARYNEYRHHAGR
ncbi:MAG: complex I NDUFA9 subunit family protein [Burkholderiales bacterium]|nr:complex I NDUFA9 subunit family protein [Burkholderiales bacterium]